MRWTFMKVPGIKMNVYEWLWMIIHERSRMITNDYEWLWTFTNVHERWTFTMVREGSNEGSRIRTSGSYEWPELYKSRQNRSKFTKKDFSPKFRHIQDE